MNTDYKCSVVINFTDEIFYYIFNLKQYIIAVDNGFSEYLQLHRREGSLPLNQEDRLNPLGRNVIKYYNEFSLLINGRR